MKKAPHIHLNNHVKAGGLLVCVFFSLTLPVFAQNSWDQDNYQQQYRTSDSGIGEWVTWENEKWEVWDNKAGTWVALNGHPPFQSDENSTYIEIRTKDKIRLDNTLKYKNNLTLRVCGILDIGTLSLQEMVPSVVLDQENILADQQTLAVTATAEYFSETEVQGFETGFYLAPAGVADPVISTYKIPANVINHNSAPDHFYGNFTIGPLSKLTDGTPLAAGQSYQLVAFAQNSTGYGFSVAQEFQLAALKENGTTTEEDVVNAFNRIRLWICDGGKLTIGAIESKNNALLHIDGALIVEEFIFDTNNYCITGSGSISTSTGQAPPITGSPSNHCAGFVGILPIELLAFDAAAHPDHVKLSWSTASEINNDYFTLERSRDLLSWEAIGYTEGAGNSRQTLTYHFEDRMPLRGAGYYRLKQTDFDGHSETFEPVAVQYEPGLNGLDFTVSKNSGQWTIHLPGTDEWQVEAFSPGGRKLFSGKASHQLSIPAPDQAVVIRIFNPMNPPVARIIL